MQSRSSMAGLAFVILGFGAAATIGLTAVVVPEAAAYVTALSVVAIACLMQPLTNLFFKGEVEGHLRQELAKAAVSAPVVHASVAPKTETRFTEAEYTPAAPVQLAIVRHSVPFSAPTAKPRTVQPAQVARAYRKQAPVTSWTDTLPVVPGTTVSIKAGGNQVFAPRRASARSRSSTLSLR